MMLQQHATAAHGCRVQKSSGGRYRAPPRRLRPPHASSPTSEVALGHAQLNDGYFNRTAEEQKLLQRLSAAPERIQVLLGPRRSGKSTFLSHLFNKERRDMRVCFINGRPLTKHIHFAESLSAAGVGWLGGVSNQLRQAAALLAKERTSSSHAPDWRAVPEPGTLQWFAAQVLLALRVIPEYQTGLASYPWSSWTYELPQLLKACSAILDTATVDKTGTWPVLVIDAADVLRSYASSDAKLLLEFCTEICNLNHQAHVILATSDGSFVEWLDTMIGSGYFDTGVLGDMDKPEALAFLQHLLPATQHDKLEAAWLEDAWPRIWEVTRGNVGAVRCAAARYATDCAGEWEQALIESSKDEARQVREALSPQYGAGWTHAQYEAAVRAVVSSPHHAVTRTRLQTRLGSGGQQALCAMLRADLFSLRPYSSWAHDVPYEAWEGDFSATLVTAGSPIKLQAMLRLGLASPSKEKM